MDLILLLMASRWVQDGFNIGFGCCTWLIDRCKIHRKKWYGFDIALDGFKMGSRWVQHRLWKKVSRWPQDSSSPNRPVTKTVQNQRTNCSMISGTFLTPSWAYLGPSWLQLAAPDGLKKVSRWPQDSSGVRIGPSPRLSEIIEQIVQ